MTMKLVTCVVLPFDQGYCQELCDIEARSQNYEKRLLASSCVSVRPSVRVEQLGSHWTELQEI